jgi:hypothetical protein
MDAMKTHVVKSWPKFFGPIVAGIRVHELRRNDRNYNVGDYLELREYDPEKGTYTGRIGMVEITSITSKDEPCAVSGEGLSGEFCILSIKRVAIQKGHAVQKSLDSALLS